MVVLKRTATKTRVRVAPKTGYTVVKPAHYKHHSRPRPTNYRGRNY